MVGRKVDVGSRRVVGQPGPGGALGSGCVLQVEQTGLAMVQSGVWTVSHLRA